MDVLSAIIPVNDKYLKNGRDNRTDVLCEIIPESDGEVDEQHEVAISNVRR